MKYVCDQKYSMTRCANLFPQKGNRLAETRSSDATATLYVCGTFPLGRSEVSAGKVFTHGRVTPARMVPARSYHPQLRSKGAGHPAVAPALALAAGTLTGWLWLPIWTGTRSAPDLVTPSQTQQHPTEMKLQPLHRICEVNFAPSLSRAEARLSASQRARSERGASILEGYRTRRSARGR